MKLVGQFDTDGRYSPYAQPQEVYRFGRCLCDEDGFTVGILDDYGDWVSANMHRLGLKSKLQIDEATPMKSLGPTK